MNFVVGSGPSGVAAAAALLKKNEPVTMIDAGLQVEPEIRRNIDRLKSQPYEQWDSTFLNQVKNSVDPDTSGLPIKYFFGSDFHIRDIDRYIIDTAGRSRYCCSLAQGGLSNVWGGAVLPYSSDDLSKWPISTADLEPYYRDVLSWIPFCGAKDDLESIFPLYNDKVGHLPMSKQAEGLWSDLEKNRESLKRKNVFFGKARLAVKDNCILCGFCMHGCPYNLIYNTMDTLENLKRHPNFRYVPDLIVEKFVEENGSVRIEAKSLKTQGPVEFQARKVFLACGVLNTTKIVLSSLGLFSRDLPVRTSQHFILPLLRFKADSKVHEERLHALSQIFIELFDAASPEGNCHLQVYTFNDLYPTVIKKKAGIFYQAVEKLIQRSVLSRLLIVQGYLSSAFSPTLMAHLDQTSGKLKVSAVKNDRTASKLSDIVGRIRRLAFSLKAAPISPLLKISDSGVGAHIGASFPMRIQPGAFETDTLGRLKEFRLVHLVDASVFTDIPPSTVTLTAMANSFRIASQS